jgi:3-oxoacyl-[acyl-carrier-protein] synthase II
MPAMLDRPGKQRVAVVVTGVGVVSPYGAGLARLMEGLGSGRSAIGPFELFDTAGHRTRVAGHVPAGALELPAALQLFLELGSRGHAPHRSRSEQLALVAAFEAWCAADLGAPGEHPQAGLFFGSSTGGLFEGEEGLWDASRRSAGRGRAARFAVQPTGAPAAALARAFGLCGPVETLATACAASTMALEAALDALRSGEVELALAGGTDGLCQTTYGGFNSLRAVDELPARPFRADRQGLSLGEGAGVLVLETEQHALRRGARPLARLAGAASTCDAQHMTAPHEQAEGAARAMELALADAGLHADDVDFVNAHGTGTPHNDAAEWRAIERVFGARARSVPLTSTKGSIGHALGACGALEAAATVADLVAGRVHPTPGAGPVDPAAPADLVLGGPRSIPGARVALSLNLAFGGANAALVFARHGGAGE